MAYKLLIVDDEKTIREGLAKIVSWHSMGFEVAATLADGSEAIEYIQANHVDVILTDITMTFVSGLELAKFVYETMPHIKVVIITGYKEFEYAKRAIEYNVVHYLLKPTQLGELNEVFIKLKKQLDKEMEEIKQMEDVMPLLQEQFFSDLIVGALKSKKEISDWIKRIGMDIDAENTRCAVLNISLPEYDHDVTKSWKYGKDSFYSAVRNFLHVETNHTQFLPVYSTGETILVIAFALDQMDEEALHQELIAYFADSKVAVKELLNIDIEMGIESIFNNIFEISGSRFLFQKEEDSNGKAAGNADYKRLLEQQKVLISYISDGNSDAVFNIFDTIVSEFGDTDTELFKDFIGDLFVLLENKLKNLGIEIQTENILGGSKPVIQMKNEDEVLAWCKEALFKILSGVKENHVRSESKFTQTIKEYIHSNYHNDISLEDAANYVFLSSSHFGRIFKKQFGENFSDYLLKIRMERAMELLRNPDYKVYEICEMVGYKTLKYFYKLFKQNAGLTPSEYRSENLKR